MKNVLIVNPFFLPGYKSGGPQQTVKNICDCYSDKADIYLLTLNHDFNEVEKYDYPTNQWLDLYGIKVKYLSDQQYSFNTLKINAIDKDCVLACGLFCKGTIKLIVLNGLCKNFPKLFVAPMGVFSPSAYASKGIKKKIFNYIFTVFGFYKKITWTFTSLLELEAAKTAIGTKSINAFIIAEDLPRKVDYSVYYSKSRCKVPGEIRIVFISRISPMKNLEYALDLLKGLKGNIVFDIYGVIEDKDYWASCQKSLSHLSEHFDVKYCGSIKPNETIDVFSKYDIFLFPTKGENYGHVIYEALAAGCIPVISNNTPWCDLEEKEAGTSIDLSDKEQFITKIQQFIDMDYYKMSYYRTKAIDYAKSKYYASTYNSGYNSIFL